MENNLEKNQNIIKDNKVNRIVKYNGDEKQITFLDQRFYSRNEKYYPSVTYILSFIPKNHIFISWLKEKGEDADNIAKIAAEKGKQVHKAIEKLLYGEEIKWINDNGDVNFSLEVWQMLLRFQEFWKKYSPELVGAEIHVFSDQYEYAGTVDLIVKINGELWLLDIKTTNQVPPIYFYQVASYTVAFNECFDQKVERRGILWLKSHTRGEDKQGKRIQGKNWQIIESQKSLEDDFQSFLLFYAVFKHEVDFMEPITNIFPTSIKL